MRTRGRDTCAHTGRRYQRKASLSLSLAAHCLLTTEMLGIKILHKEHAPRWQTLLNAHIDTDTHTHQGSTLANAGNFLTLLLLATVVAG